MNRIPNFLIWLTVFMLSLACVLYADIRLSIESGSALVNSSGNVIGIALDNDRPVAGVQIHITDDFHALNVDSVLTTERTSGFTVMFNDGKIILFSLAGDSIPADSGNVLQLLLSVDSLAQVGIDSVRFLEEPLLASPLGEKIGPVTTSAGAFEITFPTSVAKEEVFPTEYTLEQNYPNPFNPSTSIRFGLKQEGVVRLVVYNALGRKVATLVNQRMKAGYHTVTFNAQNLSSGIYFCRLSVNSHNFIRKMLFLQ